MNKGNRILIFVSLFISLCCLVSMMSIVIGATELNKENDSVDYDALQLANQDNNLVMNVGLKPIISTPVSDILSPVRVSFDNTDVLSYSIETEGLIATEVTDDSMEYDITTTEEYGVLDVYATYADDIVVKSSIYTYCNENTVYVSEYSKKNALERYLANAVENNIYTLEEAENIWTGFDFQNEDIEGNIIDPDIETNGFLFSDKGTICGTLEWKDDNGITHPIRNAMVGIYKKHLGMDIRIETTYTDISGFFSISILPKENVYIGVFAGDTNIKVKSSILDLRYRYIYDENRYDISSNSITTVNLEPIDMSTDEGQAIQIAQAALVARNYAYIMTREFPSNVKIFYPAEGDNCSYNPYFNRINIIKTPKISGYPSAYASWDTIMHEYGHHMQYILNNANNPGLEHSSSQNNADRYRNKDTGTRLAWAEAWPTVFAIMAQDYYKNYLYNIDTVADTCYQSYGGINYDIENTLVALGESCERSIMAVLWDIYDNQNEANDNVSLGHQSFWDSSTISGTYTFSDFMQNFYEQYPEYIDDIGLNLAKYKMSTTKPIVSNIGDISVTNPISVSWYAQGGSIYYPNNRFSIIAYGNEQEIFRKDNVTTISYSFTENEWQQLLSNLEYTCNENLDIKIAILAYQVDDSYTTGPYYSECVDVSIQLDHDYELYNYCYTKCSHCNHIIQVKEHDYTYRYESMNNVATHYAYCECGDYSSSTHTYEEYNSCYEKCSECGYKNQIAEHDYTYEYLPNPDDTETHFAYCECGKKSFTPQDHSFVPGALADTCEFCGINRDHEHYYTYTPCGDGETHRKSCACGYTQYQQCFGMTMPGQLSRCSMCGQRLNGGLITPLGEEDVALPSNKENELEEETE